MASKKPKNWVRMEPKDIKDRDFGLSGLVKFRVYGWAGKQYPRIVCGLCPDDIMEPEKGPACFVSVIGKYGPDCSWFSSAVPVSIFSDLAAFLEEYRSSQP